MKYLLLLLAALCVAEGAHAQAGPPFFTNDPGTPGNTNWEINLASAQTISRGIASYQIPQVDLNYGIGDRVQLTYEIPYVVETSEQGHSGAGGQSRQSGWGNAFPGIKWRFLDQGEDGWQASVFPQIEANGTAASLRNEIAQPGPRFLLPVEVSKKFGPIDLDFEVGYYLPKQEVKEHILGFVAGHDLTDRLEMDVELYNDHATGAPPNQTTLGLGGRYKMSRSFIALFMAGRSISGTANGQPQFVGYFGVQILLSDYGRALASEP
jgi:hypothetical protein